MNGGCGRIAKGPHCVKGLPYSDCDTLGGSSGGCALGSLQGHTMPCACYVVMGLRIVCRDCMLHVERSGRSL